MSARIEGPSSISIVSGLRFRDNDDDDDTAVTVKGAALGAAGGRLA
jgi:hypothetical protein